MVVKRLLLLAFGLMTAACAPTQVAINGRFPANYPQAAELRQIMVNEFDGRAGRAFTPTLFSELSNAEFDGQRHFTIVNSERNYGDALATARQLGAQAVMSGNASVDSDETYFTESRRECDARNDKNKCIQWRDYEVSCTNRTIQVSVAPRFTRATDATVVYSSQKTATRRARWCQDRSRNETDDQLIMQAYAEIATAIRRDVAPYAAVLHATLKESHEGLRGAEAQQFDQAVALAKAGNVGGACDAWRAISTSSPDHVWTVYNLGICAEAKGDYGAALTQYQRAGQLGGAADAAVVESVNRVSGLMSAEGRLAQAEAGRRAAAEAEARRAAEVQRAQEEAARQAEAARAARHAELVSRYGAAAAAAIANGQVNAGMTAEQVWDSILTLAEASAREHTSRADRLSARSGRLQSSGFPGS